MVKIKIIIEADTEEDKERIIQHFNRFCVENFQKPVKITIE